MDAKSKLIKTLWQLWADFAECGEMCINRNFIKNYKILEDQVKNLTIPSVNYWVDVKEKPTPDYDGTFLCFIQQKQECGNIWEYQKIVECAFNSWILLDKEVITHWKEKENPPCS